MVPNGWETRHLEELTTKISDGIHSTPKYAELSPVYFVNGNNLKNGKIVIQDSTKFVDEDNAKKHRKNLSNRTILMSINGTIGNIAYYGSENIVLGKSACYINVDENTNVDFIYYVLSSAKTQAFFTSELTGSTIKNLSLKTIKLTKIDIPPLLEQRKIAQILSTWDRGIATTEKLIETSKQQKKALMQHLLTGKKRLLNPETGKAFEGEWEEVKLKQLGKCITGLTYSPSDVVDEGTLVLRSSNIQGGKLSFLDNVYVSSHIKEESKTRVGDILICVRNGSRNLIGKSAYITDKASGQAHGAFMTMFRGKYAEFVFQLFQSPLFYRQVNKNLGATINSINTSDLHKFKFDLPKDKNEIQRIASVLTAADKERESLEAKLAHFKQEKKALMQQLLTGKRRVKVAETEAA
ncbi:type I restriction enzyme, S subunit [Vibrio crassostreae]|uniref:restriction endonuclease subunit S n=1 Tax=Vibrio crassostreae TaxID=246167 RepID=UPI0010538B59|nr:restriction endonuclease subunit S [Vibrio crassostreae]TCN81438.1 type I restriction enzyme S subunit [Vibrio crassostreae]CAK2470473.1 type I restriction enzyme, S subunit [Vibrio crassostreae]CAK3878584.1 type I restriction enzyme, S subunit [Vibrio crassostreae]